MLQSPLSSQPAAAAVDELPPVQGNQNLDHVQICNDDVEDFDSLAKLTTNPTFDSFDLSPRGGLTNGGLRCFVCRYRGTIYPQWEGALQQHVVSQHPEIPVDQRTKDHMVVLACTFLPLVNIVFSLLPISYRCIKYVFVSHKCVPYQL